jgi:hypothetical protein
MESDKPQFEIEISQLNIIGIFYKQYPNTCDYCNGDLNFNSSINTIKNETMINEIIKIDDKYFHKVCETKNEIKKENK